MWIYKKFFKTGFVSVRKIKGSIYLWSESLILRSLFLSLLLRTNNKYGTFV